MPLKTPIKQLIFSKIKDHKNEIYNGHIRNCVYTGVAYNTWNVNNMIKIIENDNPIKLEIGRDTFYLATEIATYIENNPMESDFFCMRPDIEENIFAGVLGVLRQARNSMNKHDTIGFIYLDRGQYCVLEAIFWFGRNFGDDVAELEELYDDIWNVHIPLSKI